jgi:XisH protein
MSAKNIYHATVVHALEADGWKITNDPLTLSFGGRDLFVDLGAERVTIAAERGGQRIAVEIQSFLGRSPVRNLEGRNRPSALEPERLPQESPGQRPGDRRGQGDPAL